MKVPGIGKKTAERLLPSSRASSATPSPRSAAVQGDAHGDILQALVALGYNDREAAAALKALPAEVGVSEADQARAQGPRALTVLRPVLGVLVLRGRGSRGLDRELELDGLALAVLALDGERQRHGPPAFSACFRSISITW